MTATPGFGFSEVGLLAKAGFVFGDGAGLLAGTFVLGGAALFAAASPLRSTFLKFGLFADIKLAAGSRNPPATTPAGTVPGGEARRLPESTPGLGSGRLEALCVGCLCCAGGMLFIDLRCSARASSSFPVDLNGTPHGAAWPLCPEVSPITVVTGRAGFRGTPPF